MERQQEYRAVDLFGSSLHFCARRASTPLNPGWPPMKTFGGNDGGFSKVITHLITLTMIQIDSVNLSSAHHDPSGKNSGLLLGCYWPPEKKNYWSLRFEPWTKIGFKECSIHLHQISSSSIVFLPHLSQQEQRHMSCVIDGINWTDIDGTDLVVTVYSVVDTTVQT